MRRRQLLAFPALCALLATPALGQTAQSSTPQVQRPPDGDFIPLDKTATMIPATAFVMPDVPDDWNKKGSYDGRGFSIRPSVVIIGDYVTFSQDEASISQVGTQKNEWDLRTFRLMSSGKLKFSHPVQYFVSVEIKGQDHAPDGTSKLGFTDWYFSTMLGKFAEVRYGKIKEPFVYEIVGDSANLQQQERILSPFLIPTRNIGVRFGNAIAHQRMTWAAGWYNDWWTTHHAWKGNGNQFAGRLTGLVFASDNDANYVHLGISGRYLGADDDSLRFRQRPESNTAATTWTRAISRRTTRRRSTSSSCRDAGRCSSPANMGGRR